MKNIVTKVCCICLAFILIFSLSACSFGELQNTDPEIILRYVESQPDGHPEADAAVFFANEVFKKSNGRIAIEIYKNQELGDEYEVIEQLEIGGVDFTRVSSNSLTDISSDFAALQLPFIFDSEDHMWRVLDGKIGEKLFRGLDDAGIIGLSWFSSGKRCFYSSKRIDNIDDLAGMKIRTQNSEVMTAIVKALGAEPISVYYSDVYGAFSVGTIDAAENNMPSYYKMRHYEKANYFLTDGHSMMPDVFIASSTLKEELSSDDFAIITNCAKDAAIYERSLWDTAEQTSALKLKESGVVFRHLTEAEHIALKQKLQPVVDEFAKDHYTLINDIKALGD